MDESQKRAGRPRPRTQQAVQRKGMIAAAAVGAVFVGVVGWFVVRGGGGLAERPEAPGPVSRPAALQDQAGTDPQLIGSEGFRGDIMDKKDPTRKAGEVSYLKMDPLPGQRWAVEQPDLLLFLKDGRTLHIRADKADLYRPDQQKEPEAGTISGDVVAELYEARADGKKIDPKVDRPVGTFRTESISFDLTLETASTDDLFHVETAELSFAGKGLRAVLNQVRERLESLTIKEQGRLAMRPDRAEREKPLGAKPAPAGAPAGSGVTAAAPGGAAKSKPAMPVETLYHATFDRDVKVLAGGREVDADQLHVWARMLDGKLPERALAEVKTARVGGAKPAGAGRDRADRPAPAAGAGGTPQGTAVAGTGAGVKPEVGTPVSSDELVLTWAGPCTITPMEEAPAQLKNDHVAMRLVSPTAGEVRFKDPGQGGTGHAAVVEYGATTGKLTLVGSEKGPAAFDLANGRGIETGRIEADLVHGLVHIPIAGVLRDEDRREASAVWNKQADFAFVVRDGALTNELKQATFDGGFRGTQKEGVLRGEFARADFAPTPERPFNLTRLIVEGNAAAETPKSGRVSGDKLDAAFRESPDGKNPELRAVTVVGNAVAEKELERLTAHTIEAQLESGKSGRPEIASAMASGRVHYTNAEPGRQVTADAEQMRADLGYDARLRDRRQIVDLTGPKVVLSQGEQSTVTGTQVRLDGRDERIQVFGAGTFDQRDEKHGTVRASWADGMIFDNAAGVVDCFGDAVATATPKATERQRLEAGRIRIDLVPRAEAKSEGLEDTEKRLRRSVATGSILEREGGTNARATIEEFVADASAPGGMRRVQLQYLEGPTIIADHVARTLDVPTAGRLLVVDRTDGKSAAEDHGQARTLARATQPEAPAIDAGSARGDALFDWDGSLHVEQATATMEMKRNVRLTRRDLKDGQITNLTCDRLTARATGGEGGDGGEHGRLKSATAVGAVYVTMGPPAVPGRTRPTRKELVADRAEYDAEKGQVEASASEGGLVTFFDPARGSVVNAAGLMWDLREDRIVIRRPGPVTGAVVGGDDTSKR